MGPNLKFGCIICFAVIIGLCPGCGRKPSPVAKSAAERKDNPKQTAQPVDLSKYEQIEIKTPTLQESEPVLKETEKVRKIGLEVGDLAPEIDGVDLQGNGFKLSDYRGNLVVLFFWGQWCFADEPETFQVMRELVRLNQDQKFFVVGVNTDHESKEAQEFATRQKLVWRSFFDGHLGPIAKQYKVQVFPEVFLVSPQGEILHTSVQELTDKVNRLLSP